ncbi:MAG: Na/Pi symporter [Synergistales bacterium]|nr:Na/Pi symporter [Synergistales bacterium]
MGFLLAHLTDLIFIAGGLGLFLHGLESSATSVRKSLGDGSRRIMAAFAGRKGLSFVVGIFLSALSQSSTAATSFTVGLVDVGILPLTSAIVVMMGASVGATFVTILLSLDIVRYAPLVLVLSVFAARTGRGRTRQIAQIAQGISLLLTGMFLISTGVDPLMADSRLQGSILALVSSPLLLGVAAFVLTSLIQSSSAVMALAIATVGTGTVPVAAVLPVVLGSHVGSSTTVLLAGLGTRRNARRLAWSTLLYKLGGALLLLPLLPLLPGLAGAVLPAPQTQVAGVHFLFVWGNALAFLPLVPLLDLLSRKIASLGGSIGLSEPRYIDDGLLVFPALALSLLSREMIRLGNHMEELLVLLLFRREETDRIERYRESVETLSAACSDYLLELRDPLEDPGLHREYASLAYTMTFVREMAAILTDRLARSATALDQGFADSPQAAPAWSRCADELVSVFRNALGAFALGEQKLASQSCAARDRMLAASGEIRGILTDNGALFDTAATMRGWELLSSSEELARAATEVAGGYTARHRGAITEETGGEHP